MYIRFWAVVFTVFTALGEAQSGNMEHSKSSMVNGGHVIVRGTTMGTPSSILELMRGAALIVDGSIARVLPSTTTSSEQAAIPTIETDSVVSINSILSGKVQDDAINVLIAQVGGKMGPWDEEEDGDPLVSVGDRFILFLTPDNRQNPPNTSGLPWGGPLG
ncbi:MAG TPA: hypothetical protein VGN16_04355 [Acidobacteriaceae bacterium]